MHLKPVAAIASLAIVMLSASTHAAQVGPEGTEASEAARKAVDAAHAPQRANDYGYAFWPNGFRKEKGDGSPNLFCVESGRYRFLLDLADFRKAHLSSIQGPGYQGALETGADAFKILNPADLRIEIEYQGKSYRARSCRGGRSGDARDVILLESGRFAQRFEFAGLQFEDEDGKILETDSTLELVAWPSSLTFNLKAAPDSTYANGPCPGIAGAGRAIRGKPIDVPHRPELDPEKFTLETWVRIPEKLSQLNDHHWLIGKNDHEEKDGGFGLTFDRRRISAIMNIGGKRENIYRIEKDDHLASGEWRHLAMSYDGEVLRLYVDGQPAGSKPVGKPRVPGTGILRIGGRPDGIGKPVQALLDEVRIWNRALSPREVAAHAKAPADFDKNGLNWRMSFDEDAKDVRMPELNDAKVRISLDNGRIEEQVQGRWDFGQSREFTLHCPVEDELWRKTPIAFTVRGNKDQAYACKYQPSLGAYRIDIPRFDRDWETGYTDIRNYDEVGVTVENASGVRHYVPVLFDVKNPANITGQMPILCDADGRPTGIPVQLSKNWHHGVYSKFYTILPVPAGKAQYRLRIAYGFWGTLPSASHAQLCLLGYGGNGRWDQLAIGCWGEIMCFDMDNSLTPMMITDVRMLFTRNGEKGKQWQWSDGGWGGDWLEVNRAADTKLHPVALKTAYLAHGPCLSDVHYKGYYGKDRDVALDAGVATLRTDDHSRVFQQFRYRFNRPFATAGAHLFKMGPTGELLTPRIAYGNREGLIAEHEVPGDLPARSLYRTPTRLDGAGPWWIAFPGSFMASDRDWGTGCRGLIIRSFTAVHGGKTYLNPTVSFTVQKVDAARKLVGLNLELVTPDGVTGFVPGDTLEMDLEWMTVPRVAEDYYGPNKAFLSHLTENPKSWKTVHREAVGNDLRVSVTGGRLLQTYPIVVAAEKPEVNVRIDGGVGIVPIRFEGLNSAITQTVYREQDGRRVPLDQSVHGNDFWQTDYDAESQTYKRTFNLPLDGLKQSNWVLAPAK